MTSDGFSVGAARRAAGSAASVVARTWRWRDPAKPRVRIAVGEDALRRFTDCDRLVVENWRRPITESWFWLGDTAMADGLFRGWLEADPWWGSAGSAEPAATRRHPAGGLSADYQRAEDLLRQGYAVRGVRDRDAIAEWLRLARREKDDHPGGLGDGEP